jgi:putative glutamine amidotransferase
MSDDAPRILLSGQWWADDEKLRVPTHYILALKAAGAECVVASPFELRDDEELSDELQPFELIHIGDLGDPSVLDGMDGLLIPGGGDVDPARYGEEPHHRTRGVSKVRDTFEETLLHEAFQTHLPALCICHGMQILNVMLGGTLDQHLADTPERIEHDRDKPRAEPVHSIEVEEGTLLAEALGPGESEINSHHHQGIAELAEGLRPTAWSGDGVLEAFEVADQPWVVAVQWHPEVMAPVDAGERRIFELFVSATRAFKSSGSSQVRVSR